MTRNTIQGYKPFDGVYARQATRGGKFNFRTNWADVKNPPSIYYYNKSVIELTNLGFRIKTQRLNHTAKTFNVTMTDGNKTLKASMPLASITDVNKVINRRQSRQGTKVVCYNLPEVIDSPTLNVVLKKARGKRRG